MEQPKKKKSRKTRVSNDAFLQEYAELLERSARSGSLFVTWKRIARGEEVCCLVRCRYQDHKVSTEVQHKDLVRFQQRLATLQKTSWKSVLPKKPTKRMANSAGTTAAMETKKD